MATPTTATLRMGMGLRRAAATLCLALAAAHANVDAQATPTTATSSIPFGVAGVATSAPINDSDASNAAVQPQANTVTLDELRSLVNRSRSDNGVAFVNPFTRTPASTTAGSSNNSTDSADKSTPPATSTPSPSPTVVIETAIAPTTTPPPAADGTDRVEATAPTNDAASGSSYTEGLSRARARPNAGRSGFPTETPTPAPQEDEELWVESPAPSVSKKSTNAIAFDVVRPPVSSSDSGDSDATTTTQAPSAAPATQPPAPTTPPPTATAALTTKPVPTLATSTPLSSAPAAREGQNPNGASGPKTPVPSDQGVTLLAEVAPTPPSAAGGHPGIGHSSSSGEPVVGHTKKGNSTAAGSASSESTESSNQSSGSSLYSMGTASIMSIVGVVVGICVIVSLFVLISRRKYENDDDDDRDVLNYGGGGIKFNLDGRGTNSIVRLSPTFLMNGMAAPAPGQPIEPDFGSVSPHQIMGSNRGRAPTGAMPEQSPAIMEVYAPQQRNLASEGGPSPSAFESTDEFSTMDSRESDGWSSVLESDFDQRSASRCTRDTTFSNITMSQNFSEFNPADLRSGTFRSTTAPRQPGGDSVGTYRRTTKGSSQPQEHDIDEQDETASVMSYDVDESKNANGTALPHGARSTGASSFRLSGYSDFRSTGQSFDQSLRSTGGYM